MPVVPPIEVAVVVPVVEAEPVVRPVVVPVVLLVPVLVELDVFVKVPVVAPVRPLPNVLPGWVPPQPNSRATKTNTIAIIKKCFKRIECFPKRPRPIRSVLALDVSNLHCCITPNQICQLSYQI